MKYSEFKKSSPAEFFAGVGIARIRDTETAIKAVRCLWEAQFVGFPKVMGLLYIASLITAEADPSSDWGVERIAEYDDAFIKAVALEEQEKFVVRLVKIVKMFG